MRFKEVKKAVKVAKEESEMETSDDDYIDPSMDVYFKKKGMNGTAAVQKTGAVKSKTATDNDDDESSAYESSEKESEASEQESDSEDEFDVEEDDKDVEMNVDGAQSGAKAGEAETEEDGRTRLTPQLIKQWSAALKVTHFIKLKKS
jgi:hypothetical protein